MKEVVTAMLEHPFASVVIITAIIYGIDRVVHSEDKPLFAFIHVSKTEAK